MVKVATHFSCSLYAPFKGQFKTQGNSKPIPNSKSIQKNSKSSSKSIQKIQNLQRKKFKTQGNSKPREIQNLGIYREHTFEDNCGNSLNSLNIVNYLTILNCLIILTILTILTITNFLTILTIMAVDNFVDMWITITCGYVDNQLWITLWINCG